MEKFSKVLSVLSFQNQTANLGTVVGVQKALCKSSTVRVSTVPLELGVSIRNPQVSRSHVHAELHLVLLY